MLDIRKVIENLNLLLSGNLTYSKSNSLVTNRQGVAENRLSKTFSQNYRTAFSTNFRSAPNVDIGYNLRVNKSDIGGVENTFKTHAYIGFDAYFLKSFVFNSKYTYNQVVNGGTKVDEYQFMDADITYQKKDSKWEYKVGITNLLDSKSLNNNSSNDIFVSNSTYVIQPRMAVFSVKYNL